MLWWSIGCSAWLISRGSLRDAALVKAKDFDAADI
jgi:hypothetical protein